MQHIFVSPAQIDGDTVTVLGLDHVHLRRVLRARIDTRIVVLDNLGNAFRAAIVSIEKDRTVARVCDAFAPAREPDIAVTVAQALGKGDRFEEVIQHGTEVGASAFVPLLTQRCVVDIPTARLPDKLTRWRQIAKSAAEQCGRSRIPTVGPPCTPGSLFGAPDAFDLNIILDPSPDSVRLSSALLHSPAPKSALMAIGPEGGWTPAEIETGTAAGAIRVSLGPRILRTETAALVAIAQLLYQFETN